MNRKLVAVTGALIPSLGAYTPASHNLSNDSDNFHVMHRVGSVDAITDKCLLNIEGLCSNAKDKEDPQLEVTCKTGDGKYKKRYPGVDNWQGWRDTGEALEEPYPGYAQDDDPCRGAGLYEGMNK